MRLRIPCLVLVSVLMCNYVSCDSSSVVYTSDDFNNNVIRNNHFVKFYAPWCGHCKRLASTWEDLATKFNTDSLNDNVIIAKVDCTTDTSVCAAEDVAAYPTLKFYTKGKSDGVKYRGKRDLNSLSDFVHSSLESAGQDPVQEEDEIPATPEPEKILYELLDDTFQDFVSRGDHFVKFYAPWCGHCQKLAPTWEKLAESLQFDQAVHVSKIDCTVNRKTCNEMEVQGYPTLLWIRNGKKIEKYQGNRNHEDLKDYVTRMKDSGIKQEDDAILTENNSELVVELTSSNFQTVIGKGVTFVKFFAPWCGHCKALAPTWEKLATKFVDNTNVVIAKVDCTVEKEPCQENKVEGYPTLFIYSQGKFLSEYNGDRSLEDMYSYVENAATVHDEL